MSTSIDLALVEELRSILGADGLREILDLYLDEAPRAIAALAEAVGAADPTRVRAAAHRLKGAASGVGALEVTALTRVFEQRAEAGAMVSLEHELPALRAAAERAAVELTALR